MHARARSPSSVERCRAHRQSRLRRSSTASGSWAVSSLPSNVASPPAIAAFGDGFVTVFVDAAGDLEFATSTWSWSSPAAVAGMTATGRAVAGRRRNVAPPRLSGRRLQVRPRHLHGRRRVGRGRRSDWRRVQARLRARAPLSRRASPARSRLPTAGRTARSTTRRGRRARGSRTRSTPPRRSGRSRPRSSRSSAARATRWSSTPSRAALSTPRRKERRHVVDARRHRHERFHRRRSVARGALGRARDDGVSGHERAPLLLHVRPIGHPALGPSLRRSARAARSCFRRRPSPPASAGTTPSPSSPKPQGVTTVRYCEAERGWRRQFSRARPG